VARWRGGEGRGAGLNKRAKGLQKLQLHLEEIIGC
jgi:hypothetical protein